MPFSSASTLAATKPAARHIAESNGMNISADFPKQIQVSFFSVHPVTEKLKERKKGLVRRCGWVVERSTCNCLFRLSLRTASSFFARFPSFFRKKDPCQQKVTEIVTTKLIILSNINKIRDCRRIFHLHLSSLLEIMDNLSFSGSSAEMQKQAIMKQIQQQAALQNAQQLIEASFLFLAGKFHDCLPLNSESQRELLCKMRTKTRPFAI